MTDSTVTGYSKYFGCYNDEEALDPLQRATAISWLPSPLSLAENPTQELTNSTSKFLLLPKSWSTGNLLVPKPETLDQEFAKDTTLRAAGPYQQDKPGMHNVATRPIIYLPPKFAPIALANPTMTQYKAWESIVGLICTGNDAKVHIQAMQPLLNWIRAACTNLGEDHSFVSEAPSYPHPPVPLLEDCAVEAPLKQDLPGIVPDTGPQTSTTMAINHLTTEMLRVNQDKVLREQTAKAKTPEIYYGQGIVIFCRVTYATNIQQLPKVYHDIAKSPKRMERQAIEEPLRATSNSLGLLD